MTQIHDPATTVTMTIPVGRIVDGENNRRDYPEDHIRSLAASILRDGQRDPLLVRPLDGGLFGLLSGHCRARAFHLLAEEHHAIDPRCVVVHPDSAEEADRIILDTNHHRQDPDEVETGEGYRRMIDRHGWTVERLGVEFGKSPRYVLNRLAVAKLGPLLRTAFLAKGFGLTVAQAQEKLMALLAANYLVAPQVQVFLDTISNPRKVFITGAVNRPGSYTISTDRPTTIMEAIAMAGGFSKEAAVNKTRIIRIENGMDVV